MSLFIYVFIVPLLGSHTGSFGRCRCGWLMRPLPVMSGAPSLFPPSSVESRDTSGKKLQTALRPGLREPHHHHHHSHNRRNDSIESRPKPGSLPIQGAGVMAGPR